jgi:hypothetical protein
MENKKLVAEIFQINNALELLKSDKQKERLSLVMQEAGITQEQVEEVTSYLISEVSPKEYSNLVENEAILSYIRAFTKIQKYMMMAEGYEEMGEINKEISKESLHLEEEGERLTNEMVRENTEDKA